MNQRASSISAPSTWISVVTRPGEEADHQALPGTATAGCRSRSRRRPRRRSPPRPRGAPPPRGSPPGRRSRPASSSGPRARPPAGRAAPGRRVGDQHDHRGVGARELLVAARLAAQHVPGRRGHQPAAAARAEPVRARATRPARPRAPEARRPARGSVCDRRARKPVQRPSSRRLVDDARAKCATPSRSPRKHPQPPAGSVAGACQRTGSPASSTGNRVAGAPARRRRRVGPASRRARLVGAPLADPVVACGRRARCRSSPGAGNCGSVTRRPYDRYR